MVTLQVYRANRSLEHARSKSWIPLDGLCDAINEAKSAIERFDETVDAKVQALTGPWIQQAKEERAKTLQLQAAG